MFEKDANPSEKISASQIQYIFTNPGCGDNAETHTVREWLGEFGMSLEDEFFVKWQQAVVELGQFSVKRKRRPVSVSWSCHGQRLLSAYI